MGCWTAIVPTAKGKIMEKLLPYGAAQTEPAEGERRRRRRCANDSPQLTDSLLETLYPHYLRAFPSCSIVRFTAQHSLADGKLTIARGSVLRAAPVQSSAPQGDWRGAPAQPACQFTTTAEVTLAPLALTGAAFHATVSSGGPAGAGVLGITLESTAGPALGELGLERLRVFIDAEPGLGAILRDALFMHVGGASVEAGGEAIGLDGAALGPAGLDDAEALIPDAARAHPACRLLTEYFSFPDKFNFFDIELGRIAARLPAGCRRFTLHLALRVDAAAAKRLAGLSARHLLLHCAPVINLFRQSAVPVNLGEAPDYALLADAAHPEAYEIYSIESARLVATASNRSRELPPFYRLGHERAPESERYWISRRDPATARHSPGRELRIALVDAHLQTLGAPGHTLHAELMCSNRGLAATLERGVAGGELRLADGGRARVGLLRQPSRPLRFAGGPGAPWRPLSPGRRVLSNVGLKELQEALARCDLARSAAARRQIDGIAALRYKVVLPWIAGKPRSALMPGIEVRLSVDEDAFADSGIYVFARVVDHFFSLYRRVNMSTQLVIESSRSGQELLRCPPQGGPA
jgi:type VI secretion system protein ImpG